MNTKETNFARLSEFQTRHLVWAEEYQLLQNTFLKKLQIDNYELRFTFVIQNT